MRTIVDTNVVVSASLETLTPPALVLDAWHERRSETIISPSLLGEFEDVLNRPALRRYVRWSQQEIDALLREIRSRSIWVEPEDQLTAITRDPDDNRVLEAAMAGRSDVIVTGDRDLLDLGEHAGIKILTPRQFLDLLETSR